jgi:Rrf2 family transcriptional regulator, iron-sulfur cluster assembly transcription factor
MRLSTRGRYAVMAMVELASRAGAGGAKRGAGRPISLADIADAQLLSLAYLEQLFARLRRSGLVASVRGPGGGYRLGRPAGEITLVEITEAVEETIRTTRCEEGGPGCAAGKRCLTHDLWAELGEQIHLFLAHVTLLDVVEGRVIGRAAAPHPAVSLDVNEDHPAATMIGTL